MTQLCAWFSMEKAATMPYHAQCNGQVERAHSSNDWETGTRAKARMAQSSS